MDFLWLGQRGQSPKVIEFLSITPYVESNDVASTNSLLSSLGGMRAAGPQSSELLRHARTSFFLFFLSPPLANNNILMLQLRLTAVLPCSPVFPVKVWTCGQFYSPTQYPSSFINSFSSCLLDPHLRFNTSVWTLSCVLWRISVLLNWQSWSFFYFLNVFFRSGCLKSKI